MSLDPISALLDIGGSIINKIWPDPAQQAEAQLKLQKLAQDGELEKLKAEISLLLGQMEINKMEAQSPHWFVAAWRPFVGWVCGLGLAYVSIIEPLMRFIATMSGYTGEFPVIDTTLTMQVLLGMLGLGVMRSTDKVKGVDTKSIKRK